MLVITRGYPGKFPENSRSSESSAQADRIAATAGHSRKPVPCYGTRQTQEITRTEVQFLKVPGLVNIQKKL